MDQKYCFAIDRGGTFTDIYARCPSGSVKVMKLLSVDPSNYPDAPREGIRRIMNEVSGGRYPKGEKIDCSEIGWIRMGTTVATNALLERKGARTALLINEGFRDLLYIGNQARPNIFDLEIKRLDVLYEEVVEVKCRVVPALEGKCHLNSGWPTADTVTGDKVLIKQPLDETALLSCLHTLKEKGITSIAVVLLHSYAYSADEIRVGQLASQVGFSHISLSHQVMPMVRAVPRGLTTTVDAYLTPHIKQYLSDFSSGFKENFKNVNVLFMQSDGGLTPMEKFNGSRGLLSGPAGGVVGYAATTPGDRPVIGFDMGGTSTDVSRYSGAYRHVFDATVAGITIQAPQFDIKTVAAGGGSRLFFRSGLFVVGPESAGAHPGPVCYLKGGYLTVTDANLVLGRILPEYFPKIFGPNEDSPLSKEASLESFAKLQSQINKFREIDGKDPMSIEEIALGFIKVANETMCRPIRALTQGAGYDTASHTLACFGGAGGQHACAIARDLGITSVAVHKYAGILSAFGMACADIVEEGQLPAAVPYSKDNYKYLVERIDHLISECEGKLLAQGHLKNMISSEPFLHLRYAGTDCALMCPPTINDSGESCKYGDFLASFVDRYKREFGFTIPDREVLVDDIRVRSVAKSSIKLDSEPIPNTGLTHSLKLKADSVTKTYFEGCGWIETPIYLWRELNLGVIISGPAVVMDDLCTVVVEPSCSARVTPGGDLDISVGSDSGYSPLADPNVVDTIQLSIFSHRFMSIAEQMGTVLQRTAISTNIKERLDFSCALFGPDGGLVSNAPHIPVHLGAMQETVQYQIRKVGNQLGEGDVLLSNHPKAGGSHLPDLTVITPVFHKGIAAPVFFVASRGHHADIGGITPGSMPPHSQSLAEEGATFKSFFLVRRGVFQQEALVEALMAPGKIPGSSGTRNLRDNIADLKAQIAANNKGIKLVEELISEYTLEVVQAYMAHMQANAELAVRDMIKDIGAEVLKRTGSSHLYAEDFLDDGTPIKLNVDIDVATGNAICDFTGTGNEIKGNCNAPRAITLSALIYCLRCMVGHDIPLNQGCLAPIKTIVPQGSLLDPSDGAAVVGGNVLTSQRVVDVILHAFSACAASQGCMNNITFGQPGWGYYETVAGGAGAGPTWDGVSGVHTHMTNTRITDVEILELRYPVIVEQFSLRPGSGGAGLHPGGCGVIRELLFRDDIHLSILTERRIFAPYGLNGGKDGAKGVNTLIAADGNTKILSSKTAISVKPGDKFKLETPGGGGWGVPVHS